MRSEAAGSPRENSVFCRIAAFAASAGRATCRLLDLFQAPAHGAVDGVVADARHDAAISSLLAAIDPILPGSRSHLPLQALVNASAGAWRW